MDAVEWATEEFGHAKLGDKRRVDRLVALAAAAVARPSGFVAWVAPVGAERTGAYRFLRRKELSVDPVSAAARLACMRRAEGLPFVYVAEDGSSLALTDNDGVRGTGVVGSHTNGARGFIVMNAIAMAPDGTPLGVAGQTWWSRDETPVAVDHHQRGPEEKETRHWVELAQTVVTDFNGSTAPRAWFQMDRGADSWYILETAATKGWWVTVRAAKDRRVETPRGSPRRYLRQSVAEAPVIARFDVEIPSGHGRAVRRARVEVRAAHVTLRLQDDRTTKTWPRTVGAVWAREVDAPPGVEPLDWLLLTTHPIETQEDVLDVVIGYRLRWRVEEFHKSWKSAGCTVELTQLARGAGIKVWATILASVAIRILRLTYLGRSTPDLPATVEFTEAEITAAYLINKAERPRGKQPTVADVTFLIARAGGHAPGRRGPPPGASVLARGLARHAVVVETLLALTARGLLTM